MFLSKSTFLAYLNARPKSFKKIVSASMMAIFTLNDYLYEELPLRDCKTLERTHVLGQRQSH